MPVFFAYSWKLPAYSGAFLLTVENCSFLTYIWSFFAYSFSFFTYSWSFFAFSGKVRLIKASRDCKQRSLTVSKKAPTVSKKLPPMENHDQTWGGSSSNRDPESLIVLSSIWGSYDMHCWASSEQTGRLIFIQWIALTLCHHFLQNFSLVASGV